MQTRFVTVTVPLGAAPAALRDQIEAALRAQGEPLRWAIASIHPPQSAQIEAVVILPDD